MFQHSNGNLLHKVQESAASVVGDKHQAGKGWQCNTNVIIKNVLDGLVVINFPIGLSARQI